jgi:ribosomal protein L7Ae-like RNA K-turn-binding protein
MPDKANLTRLCSLLGLCRKARLAAFGHDAAKQALRGRRAKLCLLADDASGRLKAEFTRLCEEERVPLLQTPLSMADYKQATTVPAGVIAVENAAFAQKIAACLG